MRALQPPSRPGPCVLTYWADLPRGDAGLLGVSSRTGRATSPPATDI